MSGPVEFAGADGPTGPDGATGSAGPAEAGGPVAAPAAPAAPAAAEEEWRQLAPRALLVHAFVMAGVVGGGGVPAFFALTARMPLRQALSWLLAGAVLLVLAATAAEYVRWRRTRYRIGPERAELHTGLFVLERRSLARERIRSVDLTASLLPRLLGLVTVRIGTGEHAGAEATLELDPVTRAEGERLRTELLGRASAEAPGAHREGLLAALDPAWLRYAPMSFVAPVLGGAAIGAVFQVSDWFGAQKQVFHWLDDRFHDTPFGWIVATVVAGAALAGVIGALGLWTEMWWNYRLEREPGGTLRVRRGLLTSRSVSIEERRLRGVELVEPLGIRLAGAARLDAVATGLSQGGEEDKHADQKSLLPAAPRAVAESVAARVLREPESPTRPAVLTAHPRAARGRRLRWALAAALAPVVILAVLGALFTDVLLYVALGCAVVLPALAVALALDAYRNLGHGIGGGYLVARSGTLRRTTVALQRGGVIGWTVTQSYFQRRAGLLTLTATTAAGQGAYHVHDAATGEGLAFAAEAVPGLLEPFLVRENPTPPGTAPSMETTTA
ncbi:PH domain-containing protein [Streptomyces sp. NPDC093109]|uniref:PH domain-containing protein n=1 Tax=Streptomyces sp. NPDC093109 TaxID=3154977 RepID=UPI0034510EA0